MESRVDRAEANFREGYNCAQSVFLAYADIAGIDRATALKLTSALGAGFGKLREVCGAVSGMTLMAGLLEGYTDSEDRENKIKVYHKTQEMAAEFKKRQGSIICREILNLKEGEDQAEPSVRTKEYYEDRPCLNAIRNAAQIIEEMLLTNQSPVL